MGAGVMGASIAQVFATAGLAVRLVDVQPAQLERAVGLIASGLETLAEAGVVAVSEVPGIAARVTTTSDLAAAVGGADLVVEAVPEDRDLKRRILADLDARCPADVIIASNTSGLDVFGLTAEANEGAGLVHPERLVITHFFAPAHIIPLVEVVPGPQTSPAVVAAVRSLLEAAGKRPIVLDRFVPSFIVNRIQNAIGGAVQEILENGWATPEDVDMATKLTLGVRLPIVGVVQTADFTGLDLIRDIFAGLGKDSAFFERLVAEGRLGVKSGRGIYDYAGRSEVDVLKKRDLLYLQMIEALSAMGAFGPV